MIQYMTREQTPGEETLERWLGIGAAAGVWPMDTADRIDRAAASIATAMASIHGGEWRVQIDHLAGMVLVVRR